ncbi:unnamed protein product [Prunus brigantina]
MGPLSLDFFRKNNLSASWKVIGEKTSITDKINFTAVDSRQETPKVKVDVSSGGNIFSTLLSVVRKTFLLSFLFYYDLQVIMLNLLILQN